MNTSMILRDSVRAWFAVLVRVLPLLLAHNVIAAMPDTIERIKPSVVAVGSYQKTRTPPFVYRGTGFAVGDGTLVATNVHVLPGSLNAENRETLMILTFGQGGEPQPREATVLRVDKAHDLALLRISGAPLPVLALDNADKVREGQTFAFTG